MQENLAARLRNILRRRSHYRACFLADDGKTPTAAGERVLMDLARFCGAYRSSAKRSPVTRTMDPIATAQAEGRREVWLRLQAMLSLPDKAIIDALENEQ